MRRGPFEMANVPRGRNPWKPLLALALMCAVATLVYATTTNYTEPWASSLDSWAFTQSSCSGTCVDALSTDGNPADSVSDKITGRNKAEVGYWKLAATWTALGVPSGDLVDSVDGQWDDKAVQTAVACTSSSTIGIQIYDSANTTQLTPTAVEPNLNVAGDTAAWTNHNPTGAVSFSTLTVAFRIEAATAITYSTTIANTPTYDLSIAYDTLSGAN